MTKQRTGCIKRKKTIEFTPLFLNVYVHVFWLFCVTMMALQVNVHLPWIFLFGVLNLKVVLKRAQCYLVQAWFTTAVKYILST